MTRFLQDPIARTYDCDIFPHFLNQKEKERKKLMQKNEKRRDNRIQKRRKKGKCGQFAISVLLHALTITLFRQPPLPIHLAPASLSNFSSPSGCEHEEQIWSTPVLFGDVSGKKQKKTERREATPVVFRIHDFHSGHVYIFWMYYPISYLGRALEQRIFNIPILH